MRKQTTNVSSHGEAVTRRPLLWILSLLWGHVLGISLKYILTKSPDFPLLDNQTHLESPWKQIRGDCLWGSSYVGLIRWEDPYWMWQLHSLAGDLGLNKKERPSWALAFGTLCFMQTETIQEMPGSFHYGFPSTKDCDPSNCEPT